MVLELEISLVQAQIKILIFFLNLEKSCAIQNQIRNILIDNIEINNQKDTNKELYLYYKNLFNKRQH